MNWEYIVKVKIPLPLQCLGMFQHVWRVHCDGYPDFAKIFNFNPLLPTTTISHSARGSYTPPPHQWHLWNYCLLRILCILYLMDGWMDGWSSHPQTGGSSVLGLLGLGRFSTSSCRLTGMAYWQWYSSCFWFTLIRYLVLCSGIDTLGYSPLDLSLQASLTATTRKIMLDFY